MNIETKIKNAVENGRLKLVEGIRNWYNYTLSITEMVWARNLFDGYQIHVYKKDTNIHIATVYV